ncbi:lysozyme inhibitor LprI family protein [Yersinia enterocolitica]|uniref:lysozyme inhibitor LprI family protein n=1 Tax=Yersinia enterocolitica TaxID=630 RepID=UPI003D08787D
MKKLLPILLILFSSSTLSKASVIDKELVQCRSNPVNVSDMAIADCYEAATKSWDKLLNAEYELLISDTDLSKEFKDSLKRSQLAWIKYKDLSLDAITKFYDNERGSYWQIVSTENKMLITKNKAVELHKLRISSDPSAPAED